MVFPISAFSPISRKHRHAPFLTRTSSGELRRAGIFSFRRPLSQGEFVGRCFVSFKLYGGTATSSFPTLRSNGPLWAAYDDAPDAPLRYW